LRRLAGFLFLILGLAAQAQAQAPQARAGVLDLRNWDFERQGVVELAGEWRLARGVLEDPSVPESASKARALVAVPGDWNDKGGGYGYGTYRLTVECHTGPRLALITPIQHSAARLYVNGRLVFAQGVPGTSAESAQASLAPRFARLGGASCPLSIVVQASNYEMRRGGLLRSIELGDEREVLERRERGLARDLITTGGMGVVSLLALLFWLGRREDRAPLWFALYGLIATFFATAGGERITQPLEAQLGWDNTWKLYFLGFLAGPAAFAALIRALYPATVAPRVLHVALAPLALMAIFVAATPARLFTLLAPAMLAVFALIAAGAVYALLRAALQGRRDAWLMLVGVAGVIVAGVHDTLGLVGHPSDKWTPYGLFIFVLAPAILVARRFARALEAEEERSAGRQQRVDLLVNATKAGILDTDMTSQRAVYSPRLKEMLGYPEDADTSAWPSLMERTHPEDLERIEASFRAQMADRSVKSGVRRWSDSPDFRVRRADGAYIWVKGEAISVTDEQGRTQRHICSFIDITERKRQESELFAERQRLALVVSATQAGIVDWDLKGESAWFSDRFKEMLGYPVTHDTSDWTSAFSALIHPEDRDRSREVFFAGLVTAGAPESAVVQEPLELRLRRADGSWLWVQIMGLMLRDEAGEAKRHLAAVTDISARRAQDEALRNQYKFINDLVESVPVALAMRDAEGKYLLVNRTWENYFGARREEVIGRTALERAGSRRGAALLALDRAVLERGPGAMVHEDDIEYRQRRYTQTRSVMADAGGKVLGVLIASIDTTERYAMQQALARERERLQLLVRATKSGFMDWDAQTDERAFSERFKEMLGYPADADTSKWPSLFEMMHPDDRERMREAFREMLRSGAATGERMHGPLEYRLRKADGSYLWVRGEGIAQLGADGRTERFLTSYIDITHLREMNRALEESVRLREEVDRISRHDLKTPISSIVGIPRLLRDSGRLAKEDAELLGMVEQAGYRLLGMVNLSLDLFRMEQGTYPFSPGSVDLLELAGNVARDLGPQADSLRVKLAIEGPRVHARAETLLCYSMLANLVKNALEASRSGGVVKISLAEAGDMALVRVHNEGAVPEQIRARFFEKYSSAGKQGGTGLGTYSARLMARTQKGDIEMDTSDAAGTTLTVRLHAAAAPAAKPEATAALAAPAPEPARALAVLVVDDDEYTRVVVQRFLPSSTRCRTATNGREALDAVMASPPDAVIMDLDMPVLGGIDAAARIREWERSAGRARCALIAMSSHDDQATKKRCMEAGFDAYLEKPVSPEALRRALAELAHAPAADDAVAVDADLQGVLPGFLESRRELAVELAAALAAREAERARSIAHKLAGSLALYGFRWAAAQGKMIERRASALALEGLGEEVAALQRHLDSVQVSFGKGGKLS
jgi:PAS domain S-box-containing protein